MGKIVIYGAGKYGQLTADYLIKHKQEIVFFIVSDEIIGNKIINGIPVRTIAEVADCIKNFDIYVSMDCRYWKSVEEKLGYYLPYHNGKIVYVKSDEIMRFTRELKAVNSHFFLKTVEPVSRQFGLDRGIPIDRYYIESFLIENTQLLSDVKMTLEVGETLYTSKYLGYSINEVLDFQKGMDLTVEGTIPSNTYDCFICTQTFNFIYDVKKAIKGAYDLLKEDGVLLATVAGNISQVSQYDMDRWGDYWRFTYRGIQGLMEDVFGIGNVKVQAYGNAMAATAFVQGIAVEEVDKDLLDIEDSAYAIIIGIVARKRQ